MLYDAPILFIFLCSFLGASIATPLLDSDASITDSHIPKYNRRRCTAGSKCWPSQSVWNDFNSTISGRLIASAPSAAVCHTERYDEKLCSIAKTEWTNSFWRTSQVGAYSGIIWELGEKDQCFINTPKEDKCEPGLVPHYSVDARDVKDIQAAVKFASEKDLYLVLKNTGHDHLGRSSGKGAFSIWTHNLKGREWHTSFVPKNAPKDAKGLPAVTLQAGEQWADVYQDASEHGVIVVGGMARTVGATGGYLTGGGHSPFAHFYGLAVDNVLEITIITASGNHITLNEYTEPEYFWAVRGGGGSAWGVITSVTYRTHPPPSHVLVGFVEYNSTTSSGFRKIFSKFFATLPAITSAGFTGYGMSYRTPVHGVRGIFLLHNGTNETFASAFSGLDDLNGTKDVVGGRGSFPLPSWDAYRETFLADPNVATNVIDASRLLTGEVLAKKHEELAKLAEESEDLAAGFNFIGKVDSSQRDKTAVHPAWNDGRAIFSFSVNWADDAPIAEKKRLRLRSAETCRKLAKIVGPNGGTYVNEASPFEPYWKEAFWGPKYNRLLAIKRKVDPTGLFVCNRCVGTDIILEP